MFNNHSIWNNIPHGRKIQNGKNSQRKIHIFTKAPH